MRYFKKIVLLFFYVVFFGQFVFSQTFKKIQYSAEYDIDSYYDILKVYDSLAIPKFLQNTNRVKMIDIHYNILIARIDDAIIHYNFDTKKKDTLFFVFHDTEISLPRWSPKDDKVGFVIYNEKLTHGYKTNFRFIVITLNNGKVLKKEKFNVSNVISNALTYDDNSFLDMREYDFVLKENKVIYNLSENRQIHRISDMSGYNNVNKMFSYFISYKNKKLYKGKFIEKNLDSYFSRILDNRYLCTPYKIIDLQTQDSIIWQKPRNYDPFWAGISPNKRTIVIYNSIKNRSNQSDGYLYVVSVPDFDIKKTIYIENLSVGAANIYVVYYIDFKDNDEICYDIFDNENIQEKCVSIKY